MKPFKYLAPESISDAIAAVEPIGSGGQGGAFLAGGTTILDLMKLTVVAPPSLTDISKLDLDQIQQNGDEIRVGARVTMATAAEHPVFSERAPVLAQALWQGASPQLRNVATLAGNVLQRTRCPYFRDNVSPCNKRRPGSGCDAIGGLNRTLAVLGTSEQCIANYAGDWANALILFDPVVETERPGGTREIPFNALHVRPQDHPERETVLQDDELIIRFRFTVPAWARRSLYLKVRDRSSYAFALVSTAVALDMHGDTVREARLAIGGAATVPWRADKVESFLKDKRLDETVAMEAGRIAFEDAKDYQHNAFKIPLGTRTVARALLDAAALESTGAGKGNS